jgi:putative ABC transport system permease protein
MLQNYFKIAVRNLWKNRLFSAINIFGLASGLMVCLLAMAHIKGALDYDNFHADRNRIYRILTDVVNEEGDKTSYATSPMPLAEVLKKDYAFVENTARVVRTYGDITANKKTLNAITFAVDPSFFRIFSYPLQTGRPATEPNTAVISQKTAERFFGTSDPIGKTLQQEGMEPMIITGVLAKAPARSHLPMEVLLSMPDKMRLAAMHNGWKQFNEGYTYILLKQVVAKDQLTNVLSSIAERATRSLDQKKVKSYHFRSQGLVDISPATEELMLSTYEPQYTGLLAEMCVGLVTLLMAAFNYINLTLARSMSRAREVGIRKTSGALRWQLLAQFMAESVVLSILSLGLSYLMLELVRPMPFVQQWLIGDVVWDWKLWSSVVIFSVGAGILAGMIPARVLSRFQPADVLRSRSGIKVIRGISLRKTLIVLQFSISLIAMISLLTMMRQQHYMATADYGFESHNVLNIPLNDIPYDRLANEISRLAGVKSVSGTSELFGHYGDMGMIKPKKHGVDSMSTFKVNVGNDFVSTLDLTLSAGRDLPKISTNGSDRMVLINEEAVKKFKLGTNKDAVGQTIWLNDSTELQIAGVVKDFRFTSFSWQIMPLVMMQHTSELKYLNIAVNEASRQNVHAEIAGIMKRIKPFEPFEGQWYDDFLFEHHSHSDDINFMALLLGLSFSIACLGLLGMVTYNTQTRIKEVGIRKVMGAEVVQIIWLLSRDFVKLLSIAGAIALPLGYMAGYAFLFNFAYHVSIGFETIGLCFGVLFILGTLIICTRTYKAANGNPVEALGNE